ncbi:MAG: YfhO family protein [Bacteroidota bacterium]
MKQKGSVKQPVKPVVMTSVKEAKKTPATSSFLEAPLAKYGLWITLGLVLLLIMLIFHNFIAGNAYYLFKDIGSDSINQAYPHFILLSKYLKSQGFPLWSFGQGMGQELLSSSVNDPFCFILCLLPPEQIAYSIIWMEIIKIVLTAVVFYHFLKLWNLKPLVIMTGTLLYCFSGFMIVGGGWTIFSIEVLYFALLLFAFEKLYRQNSWYLFPVAIALIAMLRPFDIYVFGLFLILYFLFRHFSSDKPTFRKLAILSGQMLILSVLGIIMSMFFFIPGIQVMLDSPRVAGTSGYFNKLLSKPVFFVEDNWFYQTMVTRLFSNDLIGNGSNFKGWSNYLEAPLFYIGLLPLLLAPQVFSTLTTRKKLVYSGLFLVFIAASIFPYFRYAFWLFAGDYFRAFSLFFAIVVLFFALEAMNSIRRMQTINLIILALTFLGLMFLLYYSWDHVQIIDKDQQATIRNFLILYTIVIGISYFVKSGNIILVLLVCIVFVEIIYVSYGTVNNRGMFTKSEWREKKGYNDFTIDAISYLNARDHQFFRINKDFTSNPAIHASFNDAQIQGFFGTMSYSSFNQKYYIRFLEEMELVKRGNEMETRWAVGLIQWPLLQNWSSIKYCIRVQPGKLPGPPEDSIAKIGNLTLYKFRSFLPLGFTYEKYIPLSKFLALPKSQKMITLLQTAVVEEPVDPLIKSSLTAFDVHDTVARYTFQYYSRDIKALKEDTLNMTSFNESRIEGTIRATRNKMLFFSIPYDRGWHAAVDQQEVKPTLTNIGFIGLLVKPGNHTIKLYYKPPYFNLSIYVSFAGVFIFVVLVSFSIILNRRKKKNHSQVLPV